MDQDNNMTPASDDTNQEATVTPSVETNEEETSTEGTEQAAQPTEEVAQPTTEEASGDAGMAN
ncbi:hypothetical protein KKE14_01680 [Patescibacteria group bacterium]|nr:hypothetical protein [Patescibacteria group bacterium]